MSGKHVGKLSLDNLGLKMLGVGDVVIEQKVVLKGYLIGHILLQNSSTYCKEAWQGSKGSRIFLLE